jgi:hypothetical protein
MSTTKPLLRKGNLMSDLMERYLACWNETDDDARQARFGWGLGPAGVEPIVVGFDVVVTADDGRIATVLGFLDRVPS